MTDVSIHRENILKAHDLDHDPERLDDYYSEWAKRYDKDVRADGYEGPDFTARLVLTKLAELNGGRSAPWSILDVGCGTGLVGKSLKTRAPDLIIDGNDLSQSMVDIAEKTDAYRELEGGVNLLEGFGDDKNGAYDAVTCCGVFTTGHVQPSALVHLMPPLRKGGIAVISTRRSYFESSDFHEAVEDMHNSDTCELIGKVLDAPYIAEEPAHYWIFQASR